MKTKIEIKSIFGNLLFEFEKGNNTVKDTLLESIKIGANLSYADLRGADLNGANYNELSSFLLSQCPSEGSFIGWKKANGFIIKLLITENAKRSSATSLKCRCSEAKVLDIQNIDGSISDIKEICSDYDNSFIYKLGELISVTNFDENRWNECSTGIHFFISREIAVKY